MFDSNQVPREKPVIENSSKKRLLRVLHLLMTILSFKDEALNGKVATFKRTKRPSYVDINEIRRSVTTSEEVKHQPNVGRLADEDKHSASLPQRYFIESHKSAKYNPNETQLEN